MSLRGAVAVARQTEANSEIPRFARNRLRNLTPSQPSPLEGEGEGGGGLPRLRAVTLACTKCFGEGRHFGVQARPSGWQ